MSYIYNLADTWNDGATTFTSIKMNVTDTASNAASLLMDLQVGGTSRFKVQKNGDVTFASPGGTISFSGSSGFDLGTFSLLRVASVQLGGTNDLILGRRTSANLRLGAADAAAPVAQTLSVQSVVAGTTDTAGANLTITGSQGTGTGAGGSIVFQVAPAGSSGTAQNALADALTLSGSTRGAIFHPGAFQSGGISFSGSTANIFSRSAGVINISQANTLAVDIGYPNFSLASDYTLAWSNSAGATGAAGTKDVILARDAAGVLGVRGTSTTVGAALSFIEQTAPAAPATNGVRIYAEDNGAGKTRLMALFATGAAVQLAVEP